MLQTTSKWKIAGIELLGAVLLTFLDQWTKILSVAHLKGQDAFVLMDGVLEFYYLENHGAAFSLFQDAMLFFCVIAVVTLVGIVLFLYRIPADRHYLPIRVILVAIAAGAIGNLIDRMMLGYVRDFIYFSLIDFPVFNVADIYVTVSVAVLILLIMFYYKDSDFAFLERHAS